MLSSLNTISRIILSAFFFIYPFFFLNFTFEAPEISKLILLIFVVLLVLFIESIKITSSKKIDFITHTFLFPLFLLACNYIVSTIAVSPNKILPLVSPLSTSTWIFLFLLYLLITAKSYEKQRIFLLDLTAYGSVFVAIYVLLMYLGLFQLNVITPLGNLLSTSIFFLIVIIYLFASLLKKKNIISFISLIIITTAQIFLVYHLFTNQKPILLSNAIGIQIFKEIAKDPKSLLLGVGPSNFISAFTLAKPVSINQSSLWNITFSSSSSFFLNLISETGIISGIMFIFIILSSIYLCISNFTLYINLLILSVLLLIFPGNTALLILLTTLLTGVSNIKTLKTISLDKLGFFIFTIPLIVLIFLFSISYLLAKAYLAEYYYFQSFSKLALSDETLKYNFQRNAVANNPYMDKYHLAISKSSLILGDELLTKEDITETEKQKIPKLIEQAIEEGRIAINLNNTNVVNWDNLSKIYASLIAFAPGADKWAIEIAKQTIALDPQNPNHYLSLAQIHINLNQYSLAEKYVNLALTLKKDLPKAQDLLSIIKKNKSI